MWAKARSKLGALIRPRGDGAVSNEAKMQSFTREKAPLLHTEPGCSDPLPTTNRPPRSPSRKTTSNGPNNDEATPEDHYLAPCSQVDVAAPLLLMRLEKKLQGIAAEELSMSD
jgi:hypothetical protein